MEIGKHHNINLFNVMLYLEAFKHVEKGFIQDLKLINRRLTEENAHS
jgi:hypothetical protein